MDELEHMRRVITARIRDCVTGIRLDLAGLGGDQPRYASMRADGALAAAIRVATYTHLRLTTPGQPAWRTPKANGKKTG